MARKKEESVLCQIRKGEKKLSEVIPAELVRQPIVEIIKKTHPDWSTSGFICVSDLNQFRGKYVQDVLETEKGEMSVSVLEAQVMRSLKEHELLSKNINIEFDRQLTFGERLADKITEFGGSWGFIMVFTSFFLLWIAINSVMLIWKPFDPYPFILLNCSFLALRPSKPPSL